MSGVPLRLRLNQGDATEARIYYLPHLVALALGFFRDVDLDVELVATGSGGSTIRGGQIPMLLAGEAELAVGGPMVTMRMAAEGSGHLVSFCAAVAASPWVLAGHAPGRVGWSDFRGRRIIDIGRIGTATLCLEWLLARHNLTDAVPIQAGSGDVDADLQANARNGDVLAFHSLHHLAPALAEGRAHLVASLAEALGPLPWSAYIARPEVIDAHRAVFSAFKSAIGRALSWIVDAESTDIARTVAPHFPNAADAVLVSAISKMRASGIWPASPAIDRRAYENFHTILMDRGWLPRAVPYEQQVDQTIEGND